MFMKFRYREVFSVLSARSRSSFAVYVERFDVKCPRDGKFISLRAETIALK